MAETKKAPAKKKVQHPTPRKVSRHKSSGNGIVRVSPRQTDVLDDPDSIKLWDDEELEKGYRRATNGHFVGRPPKVIPRIVLDEQKRRRLIQAEDDINKGIHVAVSTLIEICISSEDDKAKVAAAKLILERGMGKEPQQIAHTIEEPKWAKALQGGIVAIGPSPDDIEDAVIVEEAS